MKHKLLTFILAFVASFGTLFAEQVRVGDWSYNLDAATGTAELAGFGYAISVTDNSIDDWNDLPSEYVFEATCPDGALWTGLKKIKVYADKEYINYVLFIDPSKMPRHRPQDAMHIYIDADNSDATGGFWDLFDAPNLGNTDLMLEGALWDDSGNEIPYDPDVSKWVGELNGEGWNWELLPTSGKVGASQFIGEDIIEGQLIKKNIPWDHWADKFNIGFDIDQNWVTVGVLPQGVSPDGERNGRVSKLQVTFSSRNPSSLSGEVTLPGSILYDGTSYKVTSIGKNAFYDCSMLYSINIPNSITSIGNNAFSGCSMLISVNIPKYLTFLGEGAFANCSALSAITFPETLTSIKYNTFSNCSSLTSITIPTNIELIEICAFYACTGLTSITLSGNVVIDGNAFVHSNNIHDIHFNGSMQEWCSKKWQPVFISLDYALYIGGVLQTTVTIPNDVYEIQDYAFDRCNSITNIILGTSVKKINYKAFYCPNIETITCYSMRPPTVYQDGASYFSFPYDMPYNTIVYVLSESLNTYKMHDFWGLYDVRPLGADPVTTDGVTVDPEETTVDITWPSVSGAETYELVIKDKEGNIICTLIFNAEGILTSIAFKAPSRSDAPQQLQSAGFAFTVTGLEEGTEYQLTIIAKNDKGIVLYKKEKNFRTNGGTAIHNVQSVVTPSTKLFRNGQLLIIHNGKTYTLQGQMVQ